MKAQVYPSKKFTDSESVQYEDICKVHQSLKHYFGYCLFKVASKQKSLAEREVSKMGMQTIHLGILVILGDEGPMSQMELGESLGIDKASMVKLIDKLEKLKLISRKSDINDRRVNLLTVTDRGKKTAIKAKEIVLQVEKKFLLCLSDQEQANLRLYLSKLVTFQD